MAKTLGQSRTSRVLALAVRLGKEIYGIPLEAVEEVLPALQIEPVPQCPDYLLGVVFVRGHLIPVLDGAERLGLKGYQHGLEPNLVCLRVGGRLIGLQVDEALDLVEIKKTEKLTLEELGARQGFFCGVAELNGDVIRLLDPQQLLAPEETMEIATASRAAESSL